MPLNSIAGLRIHSSGCRLIVRINGFAVHREMIGHGGSGELPAGHWLLPGENLMEVEAYPVIDAQLFDGDAECQIALSREGNSQPGRTALVNITVPEFLEASRVAAAGNTTAVVRRDVQFDAGSDFPRWGWADAVPVDPEKDRDSVIRVLQQFHSALVERDVDRILRMLDIRCREVAASRRISVDEQRESTRSEFERYLNSGWIPAEFSADESTLIVSSQGRLAHLESAQGTSAICLETSELIYELSAVCTHTALQGWHICR